MELVLGRVYDQLKTTLGMEYTLIRNAPNELEKLKRLMRVISNVQLDAVGQDSSQQQALSDWLDEMKDAAYDAEDIIDSYDTEILQHRSNSSKNSNNITTRFICRVNDFFSRTTNPLIFRHKIASSVQKTFDRLIDIAKEREYHLTLSGRDRRVGNLRPETFSYMGGDVVLGREHDRQIVIDRLFKVTTNTEVLVLVGMGGIGKTAVAKLVYNDSHADVVFGKRKLWVCVSNFFDLSKVVKLVIEQIEKKPCQIEGLQALTMKLIDLLDENLYFLVLDDVWTNASLNRDFWSKMKSLFHNCKILVTTREEKVTFVIQKSYMHRVGCLPEDVCWSLFENMAFPDGTVKEELKEIGKRIVNKCKGVPLAVRVLGSMMQTKQEESDWSEVEKSNIFDTNYIEGENEISEILKFSYNNLPLKSRICFVYCSIFPKDSFIKKMDLFQQWTGNGFICPHEANEIFMDLLSRCFFQDVEKDECGNIYSCKMHDLIHDLAQSIAKCQCGILNNSNYQDEFLSNRKNIRYLSIDMGEEASYYDIPIQLKDAQKLRTLQSFSPKIMNKQFLVDCFAKLKFLRVLNCRKANIEDVPSSIDNLKLLTYVDFSWTKIKKLPETICNLQNLQTLKINSCLSLRVLPKMLRRLSELRNLEIECCSLLDSMPVGMDHLSLLQTLNFFFVNDDGKNLNELRHLNHLGGNLCIQHLGRIRNVDLENGILSRKENLVSLHLHGGREEIEEKVLEALQPHPNLKSLTITQFRGICLPTWMKHLSFLQQLHIHDWETHTSVPNSMSCLNSLTVLKIMYCEMLTSLPNSMTCLNFLTVLIINRCKNFTSLPNNMSCLQSLTHLYISWCKNLTSLPNSMSCLQSLKDLHISNCKNLTSLPNSMSCLQSLTDLHIFNCKNLTSLPNTMGCLQSLTHLYISWCKNLTSFPNSMSCLQSLTSLKIGRCSSLVDISFVSECLTSLQSIAINDCFDIRNWSNGAISRICSVEGNSDIEICSKDDVNLLSRWLQKKIDSTKILQSLRINGSHGFKDYPSFYSLPGQHKLSICCFEQEHLPEELVEVQDLQHLDIIDCPNLSCLPEGMKEPGHIGIRNCSILEAHCIERGYRLVIV